MKPPNNFRQDPRAVAANASRAAAAVPQAQQSVYGAPVRSGGRVNKKAAREEHIEIPYKKQQAQESLYQQEPDSNFLVTDDGVRRPRQTQQQVHFSKAIDESPPRVSPKKRAVGASDGSDASFGVNEVELLSMLLKLSPQRRATLLSALKGTKSTLQGGASHLPAYEVGVFAQAPSNYEVELGYNEDSPRRRRVPFIENAEGNDELSFKKSEAKAAFRPAGAPLASYLNLHASKEAAGLKLRQDAVVQRMADLAKNMNSHHKRFKFGKIPMDIYAFQASMKDAMDETLTLSEARILAEIVNRRTDNFIVWTDFWKWFKKNGKTAAPLKKVPTEHERGARRQVKYLDDDANIEVMIDPTERLGMEIDYDGFVMQVLPGGQAEEVRIQAGFTIVAAGGRKVSSLDQLKREIGAARANGRHSLALSLIHFEESIEARNAQEEHSTAVKVRGLARKRNAHVRVRALLDERDAAVVLQGLVRRRDARVRVQAIRQGRKDAANKEPRQQPRFADEVACVPNDVDLSEDGAYESDDYGDDATSMSGEQIPVVSEENWTKETDRTERVDSPTDWAWEGKSPKFMNDDIKGEGSDDGDQEEEEEEEEEEECASNHIKAAQETFASQAAGGARHKEQAAYQVARGAAIMVGRLHEHDEDEAALAKAEESKRVERAATFGTLRTIARLKVLRKTKQDREAAEAALVRAAAAAEAAKKHLEAQGKAVYAAAYAAGAMKEHRQPMKKKCKQRNASASNMKLTLLRKRHLQYKTKTKLLKRL
jgi:hypothetical protein